MLTVTLLSVSKRLWPGYTSVNSYSAEHALEFLQVCSVSFLVCVCVAGNKTERKMTQKDRQG